MDLEIGLQGTLIRLTVNTSAIFSLALVAGIVELWRDFRAGGSTFSVVTRTGQAARC